MSDPTLTAPFSPWRESRFRRFWAAQSISQFGDRVTELALPLIAVTTLGAGPGQVGLLTAAIWLPYLVSFLVGSWVDRLRRKRRVLVLSDLARAVVLLSLPAAYALDAMTIQQLFAVALLNGLGEVFSSTASPSVFISLVERSGYLRANSALSTSRSASFVAGPALGGALIQGLGAPVAVVLDAVSFLFSGALLSRIRMAEPSLGPVGDKVTDGRHRAGEGLRFLVHHRFLRASLACAATVNFFALMASGLLVLFASRTLGLSAGLIGLAFGVGATGGLLGALAAPALGRRIGLGVLIFAGSIVYPAAFIVVAVAPDSRPLNMILLAASEFIGGFGVMIFDINSNSLHATIIPHEMRSRVAGAFSTVNYGVRPLGALVGGLLGSTIGVRPTLVVAAVGGALGCLWLLFSPIPRIKDLKELDAIDPYTGLRLAEVLPTSDVSSENLSPEGRSPMSDEEKSRD